MRRVCEQLVREGWLPSSNKHVKLKSPCGRVMITVPVSPSDHRAFFNWRRQLRHALRRLAEMGPKK
jgi:hypothetical protein